MVKIISEQENALRKKYRKNTQHHRKFHAPSLIKNYKRKPDNMHRNTQHPKYDAKPQTSKKHTNAMLELII